jgi:hypothetical protein
MLGYFLIDLSNAINGIHASENAQGVGRMAGPVGRNFERTIPVSLIFAVLGRKWHQTDWRRLIGSWSWPLHVKSDCRTG